jgi:ankyrin repeat protein
MEAAAQGFVEVVQLLLDRGANLEAANKNKQTAWLIAAMRDQREVIEIFRRVRERRP